MSKGKQAMILEDESYNLVRLQDMPDPTAMDLWLAKAENARLRRLSQGISYKGMIIIKSDTLAVARLLSERGYEVYFPDTGIRLSRERVAPSPPPKKKKSTKKASAAKKGKTLSKAKREGNEPAQIENARANIREELLKKEFFTPNFKKLTEANVRAVFQAYDRVFFDGQIQDMLRDTKSTLDFKVSNGEKATTAGSCSRRGCTYTLTFPNGLYQQLFATSTAVGRPLDLAGWKCADRLECLMIIFEHEVTHLIMMLWGYDGRVVQGPGKHIYSSHGKLYKCMVNHYFKHSEFSHGLLNNDPSLGEHTGKDALKVGDKVKFKSRKANEVIKGAIIKKNPTRAHVDVGGGKIMNVPYTLLYKA